MRYNYSGRKPMTRVQKFFTKLMDGTGDANISFAELCALLHRLGFKERLRGDHHIFTREDIEEILNLQPKGASAKPYQVKQVRNLIRKYQLDKAYLAGGE
jgi:hypothetical protein